MDPKEFLHAVFIEQLPWVLGGGIGSLVWFMWSLIQKKRPDDTVLWPTVLAIFFACGLAWHAEHEARVKAEGEARTNALVFLAFVDNVVIRRTTGERPAADAFVQMSLINQGAPSFVGGYVLRISRPNQPDREVPARNIPTDLGPTDEAAKQLLDKLQISPSTALDSRTSDKVPRGDIVRGWLRFPLSEADLAATDGDGATLRVSFADYLGKIHLSEVATIGADHPLAAEPGCNPQFYCPGLVDE